ncbi:MAG: DUF4194 domain-containing protein [Cyanobacteria bacterium J06627_28]
MSSSEGPVPYAPVIIKLLQGVLYSGDPHWERLQTYLSPVSEYFNKIGLQVRNYETQGFAFLEQPDFDPDNLEGLKEPLPRLVTKRRLSFRATVFYVLLRERLRQFDASDDTGRLILGIEQLRNMLQPYFPESNNEAKFRKDVKLLVNKTVEMGFLRPLSGEDQNYEVCPIIKAKIDADMLEHLKEKLTAYAKETSDDSADDTEA